MKNRKQELLEGLMLEGWSLKGHENLGDTDDDDILTDKNVQPKTTFFKGLAAVPGSIITYDDGEGTKFKGEILGYNTTSQKGRVMYVKLGNKYTVIDAITHGHGIKSVVKGKIKEAIKEDTGDGSSEDVSWNDLPKDMQIAIGGKKSMVQKYTRYITGMKGDKMFYCAELKPAAKLMAHLDFNSIIKCPHFQLIKTQGTPSMVIKFLYKKEELKQS